MESFNNNESLVEKRIDSFMKQKVHVPAGEHWIVKELLKCDVSVEKGAKLTVLDIAAKSNFSIEEGGNLDVRGHNLKNNLEADDYLTQNQYEDDIEIRLDDEFINDDDDLDKKELNLNSLQYPDDIIQKSKTDAERLKELAEKITPNGLSLLLEISDDNLAKAEELSNAIEGEKITETDIEYVLTTIKMSTEEVQKIMDIKTTVDVLYSSEEKSLNSLYDEGYLSKEQFDKILNEANDNRDKRIKELSEIDKASYKDFSELLEDYELFMKYLIGQINDVTPHEAAQANKKDGQISREHARQLLDAVKYKVILDNYKELLEKNNS